jgi:hypothetical protein
MSNRIACRGIAALLIVAACATGPNARGQDSVVGLILSGGMAQLTAAGPGRLAALSAREQLKDEVCIAMADGHISRLERALILSHAGSILTPAEYRTFRDSLDGISRPGSVARRTRQLPPSSAGVTASVAIREPAQPVSHGWTVSHINVTRAVASAAPAR